MSERPASPSNSSPAHSPQRIQRKRTSGWKMPPNTVYVGRPTKWGNPFVCFRDGHAGYDPHSVAPEIAIQSYRNMLCKEGSVCSIPPTKWPRFKIPAPSMWITQDDVRRELRGKDLACWCPLDQSCHGDVLLEIANSDAQSPVERAL